MNQPPFVQVGHHFGRPEALVLVLLNGLAIFVAQIRSLRTKLKRSVRPAFDTTFSPAIAMLVVAMLAVHYASPQRDLERAGARPIVGGTRVAENEHPAVVAIQAANQHCTGTFISPGVILTAGHCLAELYPEEQAVINYGSTILERLQVSSGWGIHPGYCEDEHCAGYDFGYILVDEFTDFDAGYTRPVTSTDTFLEHTTVALEVNIVGFGHPDANAMGPGAGYKRQLSVPITEQHPERETFRAGSLGKDSCVGDSGGPALSLIDDEWRLLGVLSTGSFPCGFGGTYGSAGRALTWLQEEIGYVLPPPLNELDTYSGPPSRAQCSALLPKSPQPGSGAVAFTIFCCLSLALRRRAVGSANVSSCDSLS